MQCGGAALRPLPARPVVRLRGRAGLPVRRDPRADGGARAVSGSQGAKPRVARLQDGLLRRVPAPAARRRGGPARARRRDRDRELRRGPSHIEPGPYDVTLVEGSVSHARADRADPRDPRASRVLITIGACATAAASRRCRDGQALRSSIRPVYPTPEYVDSLADSHADRRLRRGGPRADGLPVDRGQLLGAIASLLRGAMPRASTTPVCVECKRRGYVCVVVAKGEPCLGPVTRTGCGALCPAFGRGCYGCFGPAQPPNTDALGAAVHRARDVAEAGGREVPVHHRVGAAVPRGRRRRCEREEAAR